MTELNRFPATASVGEIAESIRRHGYALVHDVLDAAALDRLRGDLRPHLADTDTSKEAFAGFRTRRLGGLLAKVPMTREMVLHPLTHGVAQEVLGPFAARLQLNYTGVMHLEPGEKAQTLHRDTGFYPIQNPCPPLILATMWAVSDFTAENGATCLVPGSHLWEDGRKPLPEEIVAAEMPAGSVLMYIGAVIHGGGANRATAPRTGLALHYTLAWLRQEENQYLAVPPELARTFPPELQELMGYSLATANLGFVERMDPYDFLNGVEADRRRPLVSSELLAVDNRVERFRVEGTAAVGRARHDVTAKFSEGG